MLGRHIYIVGLFSLKGLLHLIIDRTDCKKSFLYSKLCLQAHQVHEVVGEWLEVPHPVSVPALGNVLQRLDCPPPPHGLSLIPHPRYIEQRKETMDIWPFSPTRPSGPSWFSSRDVRVCIYMSPFHVLFFEASHWPSGHMIRSRP